MKVDSCVINGATYVLSMKDVHSDAEFQHERLAGVLSGVSANVPYRLK